LLSHFILRKTKYSQQKGNNFSLEIIASLFNAFHVNKSVEFCQTQVITKKIWSFTEGKTPLLSGVAG